MRSVQDCGLEAGDLSMREAGRTTWNRDDYRAGLQATINSLMHTRAYIENKINQLQQELRVAP